MHSWKRCNETSVPEKEAFYSNLNVEDVTDIMLTISMQK